MALIDALIQLMIIIRLRMPNTMPTVLMNGWAMKKAPMKAQIANTIHVQNKIDVNLLIAFFFL